MIRNILCLVLSLYLLACQSAPHSSQGLDLRSRVKKIVLDNGLTALLLNREGAPVFSAYIKIKVGNVEEELGSHGLAHFFEHMAFKGTPKIGTDDYPKERQLLDEIFVVGTELVEKRAQGLDVSALQKKLKSLQKQHKKVINQNEFTRIYQKNGGLDLNASTSNDFTTYYVSLPANKLELWAYMESERLKNPVMREFFTEVDVVAEERRMRMDNSPQGRLYEAYVNTAFDSGPYKTVVIGPLKDIHNYTPKKARDFYQKYYTPSRTVLSVVGNFDLQEAEAVIRKYFSSFPKKPDTETVSAKQEFNTSFPRHVAIKGPDQPRFYLGYHRPTHPHRDDIVFDVIQNLLCEGRTSRLYRSLVLQKKMAVFAGCYASIPGGRLDHLFTFYGMPHQGFDNKTLQKAVEQEIARFVKEGPTDYELQKVKNSIDAGLIYSLQSNNGLANQLSFYESLIGDWTYLYELQERVQSMTKEDLQRVAREYFVADRQVTAYLEKGADE